QAPPGPPGGHPGVLTVPGEASGVLLGGLRPWSRYRLQVVVFNGRGDGPPSDEIRFDTPEGGEDLAGTPPSPSLVLGTPPGNPSPLPG
ncbi:NGCA protein, partial [Rissa tridactyla]|nr:NGCA protein [Rissa tridactyla]